MPWLCSHGILLCFIDHSEGQAVQNIMLLVYTGVNLRQCKAPGLEFEDTALRHIQHALPVFNGPAP